MGSNQDTMLAVAGEIESALSECDLEKIKGLSDLKKAIALASGMKALRTALTEKVVKDLFMPLMGSSLGFRTDRDSGDKPSYSIAVVTDCVIEAMIRGFSVVGNEFNIIASRAYFTKEGLERRVSEWAGMQFFESAPSVPVLNDKGDSAVVGYRGTWELNGVEMSLNCDKYPVAVLGLDGEPMLDKDQNPITRMVDERIPIRVNSGMGLDAVLGKARRKYLALVVRKLTGQRFSITDGDLSDIAIGAIDTTGAAQKAGVASQVDDLVEKRRQERQAGKATEKQGSTPPPAGTGPEPGVNPAG